MAYILAIETTTKNCPVSLFDDAKQLALKELVSEGYSHAEQLTIFIEEVLNEVKISINNLNAIALSMGPGSYTGLRIGVSAAKGICFALNIPLIAVDTMHILSRKIECCDGYIISAMDARRDEIYYAVFKSNNCKIPELIVKTDTMILNSESFLNYFKSSTVNFVGNCNKKIMNFLNHKNIILWITRIWENNYYCQGC